MTDAEKTAWNGKQNALGYTPVNKAGDIMTGDLKVNGDIVVAKELVVGYDDTTESQQRYKWKYNGSTGYLELWRYSNQNKWELSATFPNGNTGDGGLVVEGKQMATEDYVNNKVKTDVPANAKFTDTTYSEISTSEIDAGASSTLRTISGRRVKYILDKVQGWIDNLTKADVGLNNVDNVKQATKVEFDEHLADYALFKNGAFELWASRSTNTYKTIFDSPTAGDITEEIRNTISGDLVASKVTKFDTPTVGQISETLHIVEDNVTVTKITTFDPDGSISEVIT